MKKAAFYILLLLIVCCCTNSQDLLIQDICNSLNKQKQFYYKVEYSSSQFANRDIKLLGLVSLNRNKQSGISNAYFTTKSDQNHNSLQSIYEQDKWIFQLSNSNFEQKDADILSDSLHSPILINPSILYDLQSNSYSIEKNILGGNTEEFIFKLKNKPDQLILRWDRSKKFLSELHYIYNFGSQNMYTRSWTFSLLDKQDFLAERSEFQMKGYTGSEYFL